MGSNPYKDFIEFMRREVQTAILLSLQGSVAELGTIMDTYGLLLDNFKHVIPEYLVSEHLCTKKPGLTQTGTNDQLVSQIMDGDGNVSTTLLTDTGGTITPNQHTHDRLSHSHQVVNPAELYTLSPGDRVLVLPVNGGQDYVVVARIVSSTEIPK